ncbi:hypothetical protein BKA65DRAFT_562317 [Rhexocercosporidium sp. MPI-PUGE-AT-0058]|nr:hypothetical protein BKA65DRAFT_562317 [Rhexocercosporidium sp. MPI-PUGE-AT-0058]
MRFCHFIGLAGLAAFVGVHGALTKEQADRVCADDPAYGPNYEASYTPDGSPNGCFCKPSVCPKPCFGNKYTSPKDGSRGCCPEEQQFSYDAESLEGACCSNGTTYSFDPISRSGGCCSGTPVASFVGTCSAPTTPAPLTPCTSPFPGSVQVGGKNFINYTGVATYGTNLGGGGKAKTFKDCQTLCSERDDCVAIDFIKSPPGCFPKSNGNTKIPPVKDANVDSAISPPCLKQTDACGAIDGTIRVYRGVAYTFKCGYQLGFGNVVPTYSTPDLQTCVDGCSNNTACQGVNYPVGGGAGTCNLKSNYEAAPGKSENYLVAIPIVTRG